MHIRDFLDIFSKRESGNIFREAEDNSYPQVYLDITFSVLVSHKLGKDTEKEIFNFMHSWNRHHRYSIRYICLDKVFEDRKMVRIAVDFGYCKKGIVKSLVKWLQKSSLLITGIYMHSDE